MKFPAILFLIVSSVQAAPQGDFWILRADDEIAAPLVDAVITGKVAPDVFTSRIADLIAAKKISEVARFKETLEGKKIERKTSTGAVSSRDGTESVDFGVTFECEDSISRDSNHADFRFALEITDKSEQHRYSSKLYVGSTFLIGENWKLMEIWDDSKVSTIFLARMTGYPVMKETRLVMAPCLQLRAELLGVKPEDMKTFGKSTSATREKAVAWLRSRSRRVTAATLSWRSGLSIAHQDFSLGFMDESPGYLTSGLSISSACMIGADGKEVDLDGEATWQPREKPEDRKKPAYRFVIQESIADGQTACFNATVPTASQESIVLLLTPDIDVIGNSPQTISTSRDPETVPEGKMSFNYSVAPKFRRILIGSDPEYKQLPIKTLLEKWGIIFDAGMSASMNSSCEVWLTQDREGHLAFIKLLNDLGLNP